MDNPNEGQVHDAIAIILSDKASYDKSLNWAINYCKAALILTGDDLKIQCEYILGNISNWRHSKAKEVRQTLKLFARGKQ